MKELSAMMQDGDINDLEIEYKKALNNSKDHFYFCGRVYKIEYAKHLLNYANQINSAVRRD